MLRAIALAVTVSPFTQALSGPSGKSIEEAALRRDALHVADLEEKFHKDFYTIQNKNEQLADDIKAKINSLRLTTPKASFLDTTGTVTCTFEHSVLNAEKTYCVCQAPYTFDPTEVGGNCFNVCTRHGTINAAGTGCDCATGYAGEVCEYCAEGFKQQGRYECVPRPCTPITNSIAAPYAIPETGASAGQCVCNPGYYGDASTLNECTACPQGFFSTLGAVGASSCKSCGTNTAQLFSSNLAGATSCTCNEGYSGSPCTFICTNANQVANAANNACVCRSGYSSYPADSGSCNMICSNNGQLDATGSSCICNTGYKGDLCDTCETGYTGSEAGLCDVCATGYDGSPCVMTPAKLFDTLCAGQSLTGSIDGADKLLSAEVIVKSWCP